MAKPKFSAGQKVEFVGGIFKGKTGTVQFQGESGRVFVKINGTGTGAHGRPTKLGGTFADPAEIKVK